MTPEIRVLHVISGLEVGGAEEMLCRLVESSGDKIAHEVVCLRPRGPLAGRLEAAGISLTMLDIDRVKKFPAGLFRLVRLLRRSRPDVVQTWLTHGNLIGSLAARLAGVGQVVWSLHSGYRQPAGVRRDIRLMNVVLAGVSGWCPQKIVSCSRAALERHVELGFRRERMEWIPNGTDTARFRPSDGAEIREEWGIPGGEPVVGIAGRWTPEKDYPTFFQAALRLQNTMPEAQFMLCGEGLTPDSEGVRFWLEKSPRPESFHFPGVRSDMPRIYPGWTLAALSSVSEAFPLTLGEAMACGIPVVATDVGDCREIVGEGGEIVPPGRPDRLAEAWERILRLDEKTRASLSCYCRRRVEENFSLSRCTARYESLYRQLVCREEHEAATVGRPATAR